ncbi:MAG TPA: hypothetical protein VHE81_16865 [Lacipirellulaceae bacterium]|nr:hypothetical protein [Lacipirellulaceae bacterium]
MSIHHPATGIKQPHQIISGAQILTSSAEMVFTHWRLIVEFASAKYSRSYQGRCADCLFDMPGSIPATLFRRPSQAHPDLPKATNVNFALTIGMLKLRRRLRSSRPCRRPLLTWEVLHIPIAPCLSSWRDHIRR